MKKVKAKPNPRKGTAPRRKSPGEIAALALFIAVPLVLIYLVLRPSASSRVPAQASAGSPSLTGSAGTSPASAPGLTPAAPPVVVPGPEISSNPQVLMTNLAELDFSGAALSPEQITLWKQSLQKLVLLGPASLPAVTEFLNRNVDVDFDPGKGGDQLGYATLRLALFDVLRQINSPESIAASGQALQATGDPREIAVLAKNLEQQAPGQYGQKALAAAREALAAASRGQLDAHDAGPLFEVLQQFGGPGVVPELEDVSSKWNFYATIALAQLRDGAGIPALSRLAQGSSIPNVMALRMLAQLAPRYAQAKEALISQVSSNTVPFSAWAGIQAALSGELIEFATPILTAGTAPPNGQSVRSYHINYGHQNYRTVPLGDWPEAQLKQQIGLIDQVIAADPNLQTLQFLQDARLALAARVPKS